MSKTIIERLAPWQAGGPCWYCEEPSLFHFSRVDGGLHQHHDVCRKHADEIARGSGYQDAEEYVNAKK
jgi:hypothetical protein